MNTVTIRYFQQHFHEVLRNLPVTITRNGKEYCDIILVEDPEYVTTPRVPVADNVTTSKPVSIPKKEEHERIREILEMAERGEEVKDLPFSKSYQARKKKR